MGRSGAIRMVAGLLAGGAAGLTVGLGRQAWRRWSGARISALGAESSIALTRQGIMEYVRQGAGRPILAIHGTPGGYDQGQWLANWLGSDFDVLCPSRPGYLRTPAATGQDLMGQADALRALLDTQKIDQVAILAVSSGTLIALELLHRYPERVSALALISPLLSIPLPGTFSEWLEVCEAARIDVFSMVHLGAQLFPAQTLREWAARSMQADFATREAHVLSVLRDPAEVLAWQNWVSTWAPYAIRDSGVRLDQAQIAATSARHIHPLSTPALVIYGAYEAPWQAADAEKLAARLPAAEYETIDEAGHWPLWGTAGQHTRQLLRDFLHANA